MPRRKKAEKAEVKVLPVRIGVAEFKGALCPVCGKVVSEKRAIKGVIETREGKKRKITLDWIPYFESIDWDKEKPFGVVFPTGRASLKDFRYISPEEAPQLFEALKNRFLEAVKEWMEKGWIKKEELES